MNHVTIRVTPATLAKDTAAADELAWIIDCQQQNEQGLLDQQSLAELASSGWLKQDDQRRGAFLSTYGLREKHNHPELAMLNVPSIFTLAAYDLLNSMANYLIDEDTRFEPGQLYAQESAAGRLLSTFIELSPEEDSLFAEPMLAVVCLP
jgi:hypothetical protein